jgi:plasmid stabilization system protein ParE
MDFKVGLTDEAVSDLAGIVAFVAQRNPQQAGQVGDMLIRVAESLSVFPYRGAPLGGRPGYRRVFQWNFVIYYRIRDELKAVEVLRIWDGRRAPWSLRLE